MRIKIRISTARFQWMSRLPTFDESIERDMTDADGHFEESKARSILASATYEDGMSPIEFSCLDDSKSIAFAVEFLSQLRRCTDSLCASKANDAHKSARDNSTDRRLEERLEDGDIIGVFLDFDCRRGMPRCRIRIKDERLDIEKTRDYQKVKSALEFSVYAARILRYIKGEIEKKNGGAECVILGEIGEHGILKRAEEVDAAEAAEDDLRRRVEGRAMCPRRSATGYCTPICPDCEFGCYKNGKCIEPKN